MSATDTQRFLEALFRPDDLICVRLIEKTIDATGNLKPRMVKTIHATRTDIIESIDALNAFAAKEHACIYFGVCPRQAKGKDKAADIKVVRAIWADIDHVQDPLQTMTQIKTVLPLPSIGVHSGNGLHLYWLLDAPYTINNSNDQQRIESIVKGISQKIGGDHTQDVARLLRLPGTLNRKGERNGTQAKPCKLLYCDITRYGLDVFEPFAAPTPPLSPVSLTRGGEKNTTIQPDTNLNTFSTLNKHERERFKTLFIQAVHAHPNFRSHKEFALICYAVYLCLDPAVVWEAVQDFGKFSERGDKYFITTWNNAKKRIELERTENNRTIQAIFGVSPEHLEFY